MLWQPRQSPHAWFNIQETSAGTLRQSWESQATQPGQYFPIAGFLWPFVCDLKSNISDNLIQHLVSEGCKLFKACLPSSLMSRCHIAWIFANIPHGVGNRTNPCELPGVLVLRLEFNICEQKSCWIWTVGFLEPTLKDANTRYQSLATPRRHVQDDPSSFHLGPEMSIFPQFMHLASVWAGSWWYVAVGNSHGFGPQKTGCCCACELPEATGHVYKHKKLRKLKFDKTKVPLAAQQLFANLQCQPGWDRVLSHAGHLVGLQIWEGAKCRNRVRYKKSARRSAKFQEQFLLLSG